MQDLTQYIHNQLCAHGADLVGMGDLTELPPDVRLDMPVGICVAVKYSREAIRGIAELPTRAYYNDYLALNQKLDALVILGAELLRAEGYAAEPQTMAYVRQAETDFSSKLPHKTVATRAGIGWIGKSALLVTKEYGSMIRISSILTNAPLKTAEPIDKSNCHNCNLCTNACPAGAITGKNWSVNTYRDEFYHAHLCKKVARQRANTGLGLEITLCGKCILVCPYTRKYLNSK